MKKLFLSVLTFCLFTLSGCFQQQSETDPYAYLLDTTSLDKVQVDSSKATGVLKKIYDEKTLTIATSPDFAPSEFVLDDGTTIYGSEMMLAKYIADTLGVSLKIETMDFSGTLTALATGKVDMAISGYGWKEDRAQAYELSLGYISSTSQDACHGFLVPAENVDQYQNLTDFNGKNVIAQATSLQQMYMEDQVPQANLELVQTLDQAILSLVSKKSDAVALPCTTIDQYVSQSSGQFAKAKPTFDLTPYKDTAGNVVAVKKGEKDLIDVVNQIITKMNEHDYYTTWYEQAKQKAGLK